MYPVTCLILFDYLPRYIAKAFRKDPTKTSRFCLVLSMHRLIAKRSKTPPRDCRPLNQDGGRVGIPIAEIREVFFEYWLAEFLEPPSTATGSVYTETIWISPPLSLPLYIYIYIIIMIIFTRKDMCVWYYVIVIVFADVTSRGGDFDGFWLYCPKSGYHSSIRWFSTCSFFCFLISADLLLNHFIRWYRLAKTAKTC